MNFISLDKFPKGNLRTSVEEKILKHYKFYNSCMDGLSNLKENSPHLFPLDSEEWSDMSIDEAKFNDNSSPLPPTCLTQESIRSIDYSDLDDFENTSYSSLNNIMLNSFEEFNNSQQQTIHDMDFYKSDIVGSNDSFENFGAACSHSDSPNKPNEKTNQNNGLLQIVDWICNKENIPPLEEEIPCGQVLTRKRFSSSDLEKAYTQRSKKYAKK